MCYSGFMPSYTTAIHFEGPELELSYDHGHADAPSTIRVNGSLYGGLGVTDARELRDFLDIYLARVPDRR